MHGLLIDKACTQKARMDRVGHYTAWFDFSKAYDSIDIFQLLRLVGALPIHDNIANTLKAAIRVWSVVIQVGKDRTRPIYVKRGVYQGDTISPILFILITAFLIYLVREDKKVNKIFRGKQQVSAFMDDYKVHAPSEEGIKCIADVITDGGAEIGLSLNIRKCGVFTRVYLEDEEVLDEGEEMLFLPRVRDS
ncbi:Similar to Retrovirus-related Pol polyprotein from type-1 retrotransposable element R2 (Fragment) (Nasonia vitripennis) [Cotesia congregata]|uniref:Similar to Retrovirus-related Pol polyprotein from type-1 retrotransposable element R2 (Nasonia vitripennis) n=1 Tax=Cotesia congregata TaxID=51543 RepID=A0A8J2ECN8_COTCN